MTIGDNTFYGCGITSLFISKNVASIGYGITCGCNQLVSIKVDAGNKVYDSRNNCNGIIVTATDELIQGCCSTVIPNTVTSMSDYAFRDCVSLESIVIPASVVSIANGTVYPAFMGCENLVSIKVDPANSVYDSRDNCNAIIQGDVLKCGCQATVIPNGVTEIGEYAFHRCRSLKSIVIPEGVEILKKSAFDNREGLVSIGLPESLAKMEKSVFQGCRSLASIHLPSKIREIPYYAFEKCESLEHVIIPNNVKYIENYAFSECSRLKSVSIPSQVPYISQSTFEYCGQLTSVVVKREEPPMLFSYNFENQDYATLYVPKGCSEAYKKVQGEYYKWYLFGKIVELTDVRGDLNLDGEATISDVTMLVDLIVRNSGILPLELTDLNGDGFNTVADVLLLVNLILHNE